MDSSEAVSAGGAGAANTPGEGGEAVPSGGEANESCVKNPPFRMENPLNEVHRRTASVESKIADSGLGGVNGSLAIRPESGRVELMPRSSRGKGGDEAVSVAVRSRNDSTGL